MRDNVRAIKPGPPGKRFCFGSFDTDVGSGDAMKDTDCLDR